MNPRFFPKKSRPDNISSELLKAGGDSLYRLLARHFSKYLSEASIPEQWKTSKTILIPKKDLTDLNNFRPISLLSVVYKLFTKVIVNRLEKQLDNFQPPSQAGFRRNYSWIEIYHSTRLKVLYRLITFYSDLLEKL
ncbi:unnamed protein product [Caenorhabditis auriculariae]|uniref:Reverse transcriptase domain-containing protein n=1 Tax=Caenorhabditis auriculariae TaxID=2777116 RepID=A0A8S1HPK7_9PELO|nr:unnamed protein product [Caenorhabditis auriculariae]